MPDTPDFVGQRIKQCEDALGLICVPSSPTYPSLNPVNSIFISAVNTPPTFGTWTLLASGNLLGGQVGTVYAFKRTA